MPTSLMSFIVMYFGKTENIQNYSFFAGNSLFICFLLGFFILRDNNNINDNIDNNEEEEMKLDIEVNEEEELKT